MEWGGKYTKIAQLSPNPWLMAGFNGLPPLAVMRINAMEQEVFSPQRRRLLKIIGQALVLAPMAGLSACGGGSSSAGTDTESETGSDAGGDGSNTTDWLSGGTAAMEADFPPADDPFASGLGNLCRITEPFTIGPCYFPVDDARDDISEGRAGVPMTLALKVVDASCNPLAGASVEVWWCDSEGLYSGDNSEAGPSVSNFNTGFCTGSDSAALAARWFRGTRSTGADGNVYFKACFPGWYNGRATHIHFRIVVDGTQQLVSQFGFDDEFSAAIHSGHPDYTGQANPTSNASDNVFPFTGYEEYLFETERQWDGSMLVYKAIQIDV